MIAPSLYGEDHAARSPAAASVIQPEKRINERKENHERPAVVEERAPAQDRARRSAGKEISAPQTLEARRFQKRPDLRVVVKLVAAVLQNVMRAEGGGNVGRVQTVDGKRQHRPGLQRPMDL